MHRNSTGSHLSMYPAADGKGKWHAALEVADVSHCGSRRTMVVLDASAAPLVVEADGRVHPLACKRCVAMWRASSKTAARSTGAEQRGAAA